MTTGNRRFIIPHHRCDARPMGGIVITPAVNHAVFLDWKPGRRKG
ncbi:MAG: hypothetical protein VW647_04250 [Alphaproteobacteria bacterium]